MAQALELNPGVPPLRRDLAMTLAAAFVGWMFDGVEMGLFPLVARPALTELMGPAAREHIGTWMSLIVAAFLVGAAAGGVFFGWLGDRVGRVKAMTWSVLVYSVFSGLCGFSQHPWQLAGMRFVASLGMGGEWALGVALVMEVWPARARPLLAGLIGAAANVGFLLIALLGLGLLQSLGRVGTVLHAAGLPRAAADALTRNSAWRLLLFLGAAPAVFTVFLRLLVPESEPWREAAPPFPRNRVGDVFQGDLKKVTVLGLVLSAVALLGTWGSVQWIPSWADKLAGPAAKSAAQVWSGLGAVVGCVAAALVAQWTNRRATYFTLCALSLASCGYLFRAPVHYGPFFLFMVFVVGGITASFYGWLPLYLPELFPTRVRATGQGLAYNAGRVLAAAGTLGSGALLNFFKEDYARMCSWISLVYVAGMGVIWLCPETKGRPLPRDAAQNFQRRRQVRRRAYHRREKPSMRSPVRIAVWVLFTTGVACLLARGRTPAPSPEGAGEKNSLTTYNPAVHPVPPSPALSPEEEMKTFKLQDGFSVELVASEPTVEDPISLSFGPDGRMWVIEMRDYMPHIDGSGEDEPNGRIKVLEDTRGDGRMDKATVFLDGLVLPRALALARGGVLVGEPPNLWFCTEGPDGRCADKALVSSNYGAAHGQPEHMINGLMFGMDNWYYNAGGVFRYRYQNRKWVEDLVETRGQWGITQDDFGRLYTNDNSRLLAADLVPPHYLSRNPNFHTTSGIYTKVLRDQSTWPSRPNPGVNRGYLPKSLRDDGTLAQPTAACGPCVYRGDLFPPAFRGNAFVCEPAGNLVKRFLLDEQPGKVVATAAYPHTEFLTSTDERFRPVNLLNGPDGALYLVDIYRGLIQDKAYVTPYLRKNVEARGLDAPIHLGRIWRIVPPGVKPPRGVKMPTDTRSLVQCLAHPNGWWRDTAQRLLVERHDIAANPLLEKMARSGPTPQARLHALWALQGLNMLPPDSAVAALGDADPKVRAAAVRLCEPLLVPSLRKTYLPEVLKLAADPSYDVQLQLALSLSAINAPEGDAAVAGILRKYADVEIVRDAVVSGLRGHEAGFLDLLLASPAWDQPVAGADAVFTALASCVVAGKGAAPVVDLLNVIARRPDGWRESAALAGVAVDARRKGTTRAAKPIYLDAEPDALAALARSGDGRVKALAAKAQDRLTWPGKRGYVAPPKPVPFTPEQQALFDRGAQLYTATCIACHQADGYGIDGLAPPLVDSEWVAGSNRRLARILVNGLNGPVSVNGTSINSEMPSWTALSDADIASVLTYVRRTFEDAGAPVDPRTVTDVRAASKDRHQAWTAKELRQMD